MPCPAVPTCACWPAFCSLIWLDPFPTTMLPPQLAADQAELESRVASRLAACTGDPDVCEANIRLAVEGEWSEEALEMETEHASHTLRQIIAATPPSPRYATYHDAYLRRWVQKDTGHPGVPAPVWVILARQIEAMYTFGHASTCSTGCTQQHTLQRLHTATNQAASSNLCTQSVALLLYQGSHVLPPNISGACRAEEQHQGADCNIKRAWSRSTGCIIVC